MGTVHSFRESLESSKAHTEAHWWPSTYRAAFPTVRTIASVDEDGWAQRAGIDRVLTLECGRTVSIDEKVRLKDYGDILLEYWSNEGKRIRGWICKPLLCDFIAYAVVPTETCYLLPTLSLQRAWRLKARAWAERADAGERGFRRVRADNGSYVTASLAVPVPELLSAMQAAMTVTWSQEAA